MPMNQETFWQRLMEVGPFASEDEARRAFEATLRVLRRGLNEDEADWLAVALGPELAQPLLRERYAGALPKDEMYRWMKRYTKVRKGVAVEYGQVVCRVLAELLPDADLARLKRHLPEVAFLFERPAPGQPWPAPRSRRRDDDTLAGGRPGATRPLSDAGAPRSDRYGPGSDRGLGGFGDAGHGSVRH